VQVALHGALSSSSRLIFLFSGVGCFVSGNGGGVQAPAAGVYLIVVVRNFFMVWNII
jgi:hypothetical protein